MYALSWVFLAIAVASLAFGLSQEGVTLIYVSIGASVVALLFLVAGLFRKRPVRPATAGAPYGPPPEQAAPTPAATTAAAGAAGAAGMAAAGAATAARTEEREERRPPPRPPGRSQEKRAPTARAPGQLTAVPEAGPEPEAPAATAEMPPAPATEEAPEERPAEEPAAKPAHRKPSAARKPPAEKAAARKPAAKKQTAKKPAARKPAMARKPTAKAAGGKPRGQIVALPERGTYHMGTCHIVRGRRDTEKTTRSTAKRRGYSPCGICKPEG